MLAARKPPAYNRPSGLSTSNACALYLLEMLRDEVTRGCRLKSCWILLPGDNQALIDGQPVPLIGPGQKSRIPESWLQNVHRGG